MVAMVFMVFGNVVLRYGINSGITVSDEMSRYCFIWLTYIGAMIAMREKGHLGVDTLVKHLPVAGKKACLFLSESLMLWCNVLFFIGTWKMHGLQVSNVSPVVGISMIWIYGIGYVVGVVMAAVQPARPVEAGHRPAEPRTNWCRWSKPKTCRSRRWLKGRKHDGRRLPLQPARRHGHRHAHRLFAARLRPDAHGVHGCHRRAASPSTARSWRSACRRRRQLPAAGGALLPAGRRTHERRRAVAPHRQPGRWRWVGHFRGGLGYVAMHRGHIMARSRAPPWPTPRQWRRCSSR
jgi:TRAP-type C4-dicarboxylate transport system permease small subunit